jgi:hypothetical protein
MLKNAMLLAIILALCACQSAQQTALLQEDRAVEWDAITATDAGHNHGGFRTVM